MIALLTRRASGGGLVRKSVLRILDHGNSSAAAPKKTKMVSAFVNCREFVEQLKSNFNRTNEISRYKFTRWCESFAVKVIQRQSAACYTNLDHMPQVRNKNRVIVK